MSQTNLQDYCPSFEPAVATAAYLNVAVNTSGKLVIVDKGVQAVGTTARASDPADADLSKQRATLLPIRGARCGKHISAAAITAWNPAYQADGGKVDDVATDSIKLGTFLTGATGANQEVDVIYHD